MKRFIAAGIVMAIFIVAPFSILYAENKEVVATTAKDDFKNEMKKLYENNAVLMRNYITSVFADQGNAGKIREESRDNLLSNMEAIGNAIKPYYGTDTREKFVSLLKKHVSLAEEVMKAVKNNDYEELKKSQEVWHANADDVTAFLSGINPKLKQQPIKDLFYNHLDFTTDEIMSRSLNDPAGEVTAADKDHGNMLQLADTLANGIIEQFPKKFKK